MSKTYTELYYHLIWSTWKREPILQREIRRDLYDYIALRSKAYGYDLHAVNGIENHVHIVIRLGPSVSVSEAVRKLKGSTSHFCNHKLKLEAGFKWQEGYGALTFGKGNLPKVVSYVDRQEERHRDGQINILFEAYGES